MHGFVQYPVMDDDIGGVAGHEHKHIGQFHYIRAIGRSPYPINRIKIPFL
jgi:hypothetical protein